MPDGERVTKGRAPRRAKARPKVTVVAEPTVTTLQVDGVPTFFVDVPGPTMAGLRFRVGQADETLPTRGVSHLIEHLALHAVGQHHSNNGAVGMTDTTFYVRDEPEGVAEFLALLTAALTDLPVERMELEARILETEAAGKAPSAYLALLAYRFGPQGYGLAAQQELGLSTLDGRDVQAWSDRWFTTENAALWIAGTLPPDLVLYLPEGRHCPPEPPAGLEQPLPAWFVDRPGVVAVDAVVDRSDAVAVALGVTRQRVEDRLRHRDATTYSVHAEPEPWTRDELHLILAADTLPEHAEPVASGIVSSLSEMGEGGPERAELDRIVRAATDSWNGPHVPVGLVEAMSASHLQRRPVRSLNQYLSDLAALTPEDVRSAASEIFSGALVLVPPGGAITDERLEPVPAWSTRRLSGVELHRTQWFDDESAGHRLAVTPTGVSYLVDDQRAVTVRFASMQAVQRWEDGARTLTGSDGFMLFVHPDEWERGPWAVAEIDRATPPELAVTMAKPAGSGFLAEVERRGPVVPPAPPPAKRRRLRRS